MLDGEANDFSNMGIPFALCQTAASPRSLARMCTTPRWCGGTMAVICFIVGTSVVMARTGLADVRLDEKAVLDGIALAGRQTLDHLHAAPSLRPSSRGRPRTAVRSARRPPTSRAGTARRLRPRLPAPRPRPRSAPPSPEGPGAKVPGLAAPAVRWHCGLLAHQRTDVGQPGFGLRLEGCGLDLGGITHLEQVHVLAGTVSSIQTLDRSATWKMGTSS